ncbi:MAG TPA: hypothetical protein VFY27_00325 [Woeseiaceae bacterium]|nr:hypothetical protein [Woeseiaceae bacterium]
MANGRRASKTDERAGASSMKPAVIIVGADKGGVGKTTISRTLLDFMAARNLLARAFDAEHPRGSLKRFHPNVTEVIDITAVADQMKMLDTLVSSERKISVIDIRAGQLSNTLRAFTDIGFFDAVRSGEFRFALFHVLGPSVASLEEIADVLPFTGGKNYFAVKNFINETSFFEWDPAVYDSYFKMAKGAVELNVPKLNEMAYEQVDLSGVPFSTFIKNKNAQGHNANNSLVLRGYAKTWLKQVFDEYERVGLVDRLTDE